MNTKKRKGSALMIIIFSGLIAVGAVLFFLASANRNIRVAKTIGTHEKLEFTVIKEVNLLQKDIDWGSDNRGTGPNPRLTAYSSLQVGAEPSDHVDRNGVTLTGVKVYNWYTNSDGTNVSCPAGWFRADVTGTDGTKSYAVRTYFTEYSTFAKFQGFSANADYRFIGFMQPQETRAGEWHTNKSFGFQRVIGETTGDVYWPQKTRGVLAPTHNGLTIGEVNLPSGSTPTGGAKNITMPSDQIYNDVRTDLVGQANGYPGGWNTRLEGGSGNGTFKVVYNETKGLVLEYPPNDNFKSALLFYVDKNTNEQWVKIVGVTKGGNTWDIKSVDLKVPDGGTILVLVNGNSPYKPTTYISGTWNNYAKMPELFPNELTYAETNNDTLWNKAEISTRFSVVTEGKVRLLSSIQYGEYENGTTWVPANLNGNNPNGTFEPNPAYNGDAMLGVIAEDSIIYDPLIHTNAEIDGSFFSRTGLMGVIDQAWSTWEDTTWTDRYNTSANGLGAGTLTTYGGTVSYNGGNRVRVYGSGSGTYGMGFAQKGRYYYDPMLAINPPPYYPRYMVVEWHGWQVIKGK